MRCESLEGALRQSQDEGAADSAFARSDDEVTAEQARQVAGHRETKPGALGMCLSRARAPEGIERMRLFVGGHADSLIGDLETEADGGVNVVGADDEGDLTDGAVLHGVRKQVDEDLAQLP